MKVSSLEKCCIQQKAFIRKQQNYMTVCIFTVKWVSVTWKVLALYFENHVYTLNIVTHFFQRHIACHMPQLHSQLKQPRASIRSEEQLSVIATVTELALINPHNARAYLRLDSTTSFLSPYSHCQYLFSILVQAVCLLSWRFLILTQPPHFPSLCYPSSYFSPTFGFFSHNSYLSLSHGLLYNLIQQSFNSDSVSC